MSTHHSILKTDRDVDIARMRARTAYEEGRVAAANVVRRPCMTDRHVWDEHPQAEEFDLCNLCKAVRVYQYRNAPRKAIRLCTEILAGRNIQSTYDSCVDIIVAPHLKLRHHETFATFITPLVRMEVNHIMHWIPVGAGAGPTTWPELMQAARANITKGPRTLCRQLRIAFYGEQGAWRDHLGPEPL